MQSKPNGPATLTKRFPAGARVATHPATDAWMRGERYGTVTRTSRRGVPKVYVKLDASGRVRPFHPDNVIPQE